LVQASDTPKQQAVTPVAAPPAPAQQAMPPIVSAEVISGTVAMLSAPRPCPPEEFWLPPEFRLMRHVPHQHIDVNRYPVSIKPKKLRPQQISVRSFLLSSTVVCVDPHACKPWFCWRTHTSAHLNAVFWRGRAGNTLEAIAIIRVD
jgi:hypothetical protein